MRDCTRNNVECIISVNAVQRHIWPMGPSNCNYNRNRDHSHRVTPVRLFPYAWLYRLRVFQETK